MSYCLNITCQNPQNPNQRKTCQSCGTNLLLANRYRAIRQIGQGGFGRTFLAIDEYKPSKPCCAIKQFFPQPQEDKHSEKITELFAREAIRLDQLGKHAQIPELLAHFEENGCQYLVQEFIDGKNLEEKLIANGAFSETQIIDLLKDLLTVLQFIHNRQVIHRDIKPENIIQRISPLPATLLGNGEWGQEAQGENEREGEQGTNLSSLSAPPSIQTKPLPTPLQTNKGKLVLVDFGASKFTSWTAIPMTGTTIGSQGYTAPEQAAGKAVFASDIYSLGVTCIHLLTQKAPFDLYSFDEGNWIWRKYLPHPVSDRLGKILDKMLAGATNRRYQSVEEIIKDLDESMETSGKSGSLTSNLLTAAINTPELIVAKLGTADYRQIQDAIANASPGARILVRPGFYRESLSIDKDVEIIGDGERDDIIIESKFKPCMAMAAQKAIVKNIALRHYSWSQLQKADKVGRWIGELLIEPFAIAISMGEFILENCSITSTGIASIYINTATTIPQIRHCQINPGSKYGILVNRNSQGVIEDCDILGNDIGVEMLKGSHPILRRCKIRDMKRDGIFINPHSLATIEDCLIFGNGGTGVKIKNHGNATIRRCHINRNAEYGIYVESNGAGPIEQCNLSGNRGDAWFIPPKCSIRRSDNRE
ncbi:MAG TPA: hypothetical protein DEG17_24545 [Cyanobacteria bacterium UBA11149]|nr:hypothetical protein [Cyanobacteria bacterium UBA11367]HBE60693.1 hypothetical protein [Cyanobacteria bacterium UBA11366]HBK65691.1 hypothetical protein [Cyanobacteria bacterium UBA11166]HBR72996.1 hypothetical protein [Cyanobacteria bacterium UBA11159]HBS69431.1 hypothetical protein [Cyanobacteria bacterium UBA11153]HBW91948.1 hypothetical protein [Cyanobacteria bacterium UBA11149]HCA96011.1 hypothetical protein [Cyanobacteria bacterium UBA9226]